MLKKVYETSACQQGDTTFAPKPTSIEKAIEYIKIHFAERCSLKDVAGYAYLSPNHFSHLFKQEMNMTFQNYRDYIRIEEVKRKMKNGEDKIKDIAYDCGYSSPKNFRRAFKKNCEMTPTEYRKKCKTK